MKIYTQPFSNPRNSKNAVTKFDETGKSFNSSKNLHILLIFWSILKEISTQKAQNLKVFKFLITELEDLSVSLDFVTAFFEFLGFQNTYT